MSVPTSTDDLLIEKLLSHLRAEGYSARIQRWYPARARCFLDYCKGNALAIEAVRSPHVEQFLGQQYQRSRRQHGRSPPFRRWRHRYTAAVYMLLRLVHGRWPVAEPPRTALEAFHRGLVDDYNAWLRDLRGLHAETRTKRTTSALRFLSFLGPRGDQDSLARLDVHEIDGYLLQHCCSGLSRASIEDRVVCLRDFLRHLHRRGCTACDLSGTVIGPRIYEHEGIPSALGAEEVRKVLEVTRSDLSPTGLRDYAILMLLATYGLRATEIIRLRLEDIDLRRDILRVCHAKTGTHSELPLMAEPGNALLRYLEKGRPHNTHREVFLRVLAPHRPFKAGSILNCITGARLRAAGVVPQGRKGPHAFRHARAVSLLRSGVPFKIIGDVLGHTTAQATAEYLKLATEDLRAIGLELPNGVSP